MNGVGKTTRVARPLGLTTVSIDSYLFGNRKYLEGGIRFDELADALHLAQASGPTVVEGCCLLAVLKRLNVAVDLHVYVRRIAASGRWDDDVVCLGEEFEHALAVECDIEKFTGHPTNPFHLDLIAYHRDFRPYQRADLVLDLTERFE